MKRFRFGEITTDSIDMASLLMLLSRGSGGGGEERPESNPGGSAQPSLLQPRVFECKTCSRRFPSFQALGGHRASHKKPRPDDSDREDDGRGGGAGKPPRVHECSVCGLEFAIGQALGGHMRRHRATVPEGGFGLELELAPPAVERKVKAARGQERRRRVGCLDLNLPPLEEKEDVDCRNIVVDKIHMVDCFH